MASRPARSLTEDRQGRGHLLDRQLPARHEPIRFQVIRVAQRCLDATRRRVQGENLGHRGRSGDLLYDNRKIMATGDERLTDRGRERLFEGFRYGDPHDEVFGGWLAKEMVPDIYLTDSINMATVLLGRAVTACLTDEVPEIQSLGRTLQKWWTEILNNKPVAAPYRPPTDGPRPRTSASRRSP